MARRRPPRTHAAAVVAATRDSRLRIQQAHFQQYGPKAHFKNAVSEIRNRWLDDVDPRKRLKRNLFISKSYIKRAFEHARQTSPSGGFVEFRRAHGRIKRAPLRLSEHAVAAVRLMMLKLTEMYLWKAALIALFQNKTRVSAKHLVAASLMDNTQMHNQEDPQFNLTQQDEATWQVEQQAALQVQRALYQTATRALRTNRPAIVFINSLGQVEALPIIPDAYARTLVASTSSSLARRGMMTFQADDENAYGELTETLRRDTALYLTPTTVASRLSVRPVNVEALQALVIQQNEFLDNILEFVSRPDNRIAELVFYDAENRMRVTMVDPTWLAFLLAPQQQQQQPSRQHRRNNHMQSFGIDVLQTTSRQRLQTALRNMTLLVLQTTPRSVPEQRRVRAVYGPEALNLALVRATIVSLDVVTAYLNAEEGDLMSALTLLHDDPSNALFVHRDAQGVRIMNLWRRPPRSRASRNNSAAAAAVVAMTGMVRSAVEHLWLPLSANNEVDESALSQVISKWQVGLPMMIAFRERGSSGNRTSAGGGWDVHVLDVPTFVQSLNALSQEEEEGAVVTLTMTDPAAFAFGAAAAAVEVVSGGNGRRRSSSGALLQQPIAIEQVADMLSPLYGDVAVLQEDAAPIPESPMPVPWSPGFLEEEEAGDGGGNIYNVPLSPLQPPAAWFGEETATTSWRLSNRRDRDAAAAYDILNASVDEFQM